MATIIDNGGAGHVEVGANWGFSSTNGHGGDHAFNDAGSGSETATWTFTGLDLGPYNVAITWPEAANRATDAPFSIYDDDVLLGTFDVNQENAPADFSDAGSNWHDLGDFFITSGTLKVVLTDDANEFVIADAVRIELIGEIPESNISLAQSADVEPYIIDDGSPGYSTTGTWGTSGTAGLLGDHQFSESGTGSDTAEWEFSLTPGFYEIAITWPTGANRASDSPFTVLDDTAELDTVDVDQTVAPSDFSANGADWHLLGTYNISSGTLIVRLTDDADDFVIADAIRVVSAENPLLGEGESHLVLSQSAVLAASEFAESAESALALTDSADFSGPKQLSASSPISLTQIAHIAEEIEAAADNSLSLTQQALPSGPRTVEAQNALTLFSTGDTPEKLRSVTSQLILDQDVVETVSKRARNTIVLTQQADRILIGTGISQLLSLTHAATIPESADSELSLSHSAAFEPFVQARLVKSKLALSQSALCGGTLAQSPSSQLLLTQAVALIHQREGMKCLGLTIPPDEPLFTQGVNLSAGCLALESEGVLLLEGGGCLLSELGAWTSPRSMNLDDIDRIQSDRINRESRGGTLLVFADAHWPQTETLLYSVSAIKRPVAHDLLEFLSDNLGMPVTLTTHEGHQWTGLVINPDTAVVEDRRGSFTVQLEFEGTEA